MSEEIIELKTDHRVASKYLIKKLEEMDFILSYEDEWEGYTEIDLKKNGKKYYVVIIDQNDKLKFSVSVSNWIFLFKKKDKTGETTKFQNLVKDILQSHPEYKLN